MTYFNNIFGPFINRIISIKKYYVGKKVIEQNNIDIVLSNDGIIEGFIGLVLSRKYKKKSAFYLSSLFFDMDKNEFFSSPSIRSFLNMIYGMIKKPLYLWIIKQSDFFHPISESMGDYYINNGIPFNKIHPLPLCPSKIMIDWIPEKDKEPHSPFTILYLGQIISVRKIELIIDITYELKKLKIIPFKTLIVGRTFKKSYRHLLEKRIIDLSLSHDVEIIDEIPFEEVIELIKRCDIGLSLLPPIVAYRVSSPTKVLEYLSMCIPVIGNCEVEDQKMILEKSGGGLTPSYSKKEILKALRDIMTGIHDPKEMGIKGRKWILKNRNYQIEASNLIKFYKRKINVTNGK